MARESIYNLVPEQYVEQAKPPMYRSRHDPTAPVTGSTFGTHGTTQLHGAGVVKKRAAATFGPQNKTNPNPQTYLKRGAPLELPAPTAFKYPDARRKPAVPKIEDRPVMGIQTAKNFITANAVEAILQVPQGLGETEPDYLAKADYGKVPEYLSQVKEEIRRENDMIDAYVMEMGRAQGAVEEPGEELVEMSAAERNELVRALKRKWDAVNAKYQKMAHTVKLDTVGKVKRKEGMEKELVQIEADIERLERPGPVYVSS